MILKTFKKSRRRSKPAAETVQGTYISLEGEGVQWFLFQDQCGNALEVCSF